MENIINKINDICKNNNNDITNNVDDFNKYIYTNIIEMLENIDIDHLRDIIQNYINNKQNIQIIKKSYEKYILYNSNDFDIVYIKWYDNSETMVHNHPINGCIVYILNDGELNEYEYKYEHDNLKYLNTNILKNKNFGYKIGNTVLHKMIAHKYTESLHIYIPGNYIMKNYSI